MNAYADGRQYRLTILSKAVADSLAAPGSDFQAVSNAPFAPAPEFQVGSDSVIHMVTLGLSISSMLNPTRLELFLKPVHLSRCIVS